MIRFLLASPGPKAAATTGPGSDGGSAHQNPSVTVDRIAAAKRRSGKGKAVISQFWMGLAGGNSPEKGWERRSNTFSRD